MKTKLYTFLTSLLMVACITCYGQEIINEFTFLKTDKDFMECSLFENKDGTLIFRTLMYTPNTYVDFQHLFYKITPEGEVLDSLIIEGTGGHTNLLPNPTAPDSYILTEEFWTFDNIDSLYTANFTMFFIDANLNIDDEITVPLFTPDTNAFYAIWNPWFIDPQNDFIISFWIDNEHHLRRVGLDGTVKTAHDGSSIFAPNYEGQTTQPGMDTTLVYSSMGFGTFSESPLTYYLLGGLKPTSGPWPIYGYFFDADFTLIERDLYNQFDENIAFDGGNNEHIIPLDDGTYLTATQIKRLSPTLGGVGLAKFDMNHNPISASPLFGANNCFPLQTEIANDNTIYQLYDKESQYKWALARLDGDLNLNWDITLPGNQIITYLGSSMVILENGDIVVSSICRKNTRYCATFVSLRDTYDSTPETTSTEYPFTFSPNPVKDHMTLRFDDGSEPESVELYDLSGRLVGTKPNSPESIDMSIMPSGVYVLRVTMKDGTSYHEKILKE